MLTKQKIVQCNYTTAIQSVTKRKVLAVQMQWCSGYVPDCDIFPDNGPFSDYCTVFSRFTRRKNKPAVSYDDICCPSNWSLYCGEIQLDLFHSLGSSTFCDLIDNATSDDNHANWRRLNKGPTGIVDDRSSFLSNLYSPLSRSWGRLLHIQPSIHNCQCDFIHQVEQYIRD